MDRNVLLNFVLLYGVLLSIDGAQSTDQAQGVALRRLRKRGDNIRSTRRLQNESSDSSVSSDEMVRAQDVTPKDGGIWNDLMERGLEASMAPVVAREMTLQTLYDLLSDTPSNSLDTFRMAVDAADYKGVLSDPSSGPFTLFAPTDVAFDAVGDDSYLLKLLTNGYELHLDDLILYHANDGAMNTTEIGKWFAIPMLNQESVSIQKVDGTNIQLVTPAINQGIGSDTPPSRIIVPDTPAANGIMHQIDHVLLPVWVFQDPIMAMSTHVQTNDVFKPLRNLWILAGMTEDIAALKEHTIIGPSKSALEALDQATFDYLVDPVNVETLRSILLYHLVPLVLPYTEFLLPEFTVTSVQGESIIVRTNLDNPSGIDVSFNGVFVGGQEYVLARDNLIYELNGILIPPSLAGTIPGITPPPSATTGTPAPFPAPAGAPIASPVSSPSGAPVALEPITLPTTPEPTADAMVLPAPLPTLMDLIVDPTHPLGTLTAALNAAGLDSTLRSPNVGALAVFGPIDQAFINLGDTAYVSKLLTDPFNLQLQDLLSFHIAPGVLSSTELTSGALYMLNGDMVAVEITDEGEVQIITEAYTEAYVAAPSQVVAVDGMASNGVLHQVDGVLLPLWIFLDAQGALVAAYKQPENPFSTLQELVILAGLVEDIQNMVDRTLLAPNNNAFAKLPQAAIDFLVDPENVSILQAVLLYHVAVSVLPYNRLALNQEVATLRGERLLVSTPADKAVTPSDVIFHGARVTGKGVILARDNLIYEIDSVLIPPLLESVIPRGGPAGGQNLVDASDDTGSKDSADESQDEGTSASAPAAAPIPAPVDSSSWSSPLTLDDEPDRAETTGSLIRKGTLPMVGVLQTSGSSTLWELISSFIQYNQMRILLLVAGFDENSPLNDPAESLTLVTPNSAAFTSSSGFDAQYFVRLTGNTDYDLQLNDLLLFHAIRGAFSSSELFDGLELTTVNGGTITVRSNAGSFELVTPTAQAGLAPASAIVNADEFASNGVIHEIGEVLQPSWMFLDPVTAMTQVSDERFSTLLLLISFAGLTDSVAAMERINLQAPNNAAFAALPTQTLTFLTNPNNVDVLTKLLQYHICTRMLPYTKLNVNQYASTALPTDPNSFPPPTFAQERVYVQIVDRPGLELTFNGIPVVNDEIMTRDALVYELSEVLVPPQLEGIIPGV